MNRLEFLKSSLDVCQKTIKEFSGMKMNKDENLQYTRCCNVMLELMKKYGAAAKEQKKPQAKAS